MAINPSGSFIHSIKTGPFSFMVVSKNLIDSVYTSLNRRDDSWRGLINITYTLYSIHMLTFKAFKKQALKNPEVKKAYDALEPEFALASALIGMRVKRGLTQAALAKKMGTKQSAIARLESGTYNSSLKMLEKVAKALDAKLTVKIS